MKRAIGWGLVSSFLLAVFLIVRPVIGRLTPPPESADDYRSTDNRTEQTQKPLWRPTPTPTPIPITANRLSDVERLVLERIDRERKTAGLNGLELDPVLSDIAAGHSQNMLFRNIFGHNIGGNSYEDRVARNHRRLIGLTGETIYQRSVNELALNPGDLADVIVRKWMDYPAERDTLLRVHFSHAGMGIVEAQGEIRATLLLAAVYAWTDQPVPTTIKQGDTIDLSAKSVITSATQQPVECEIWNPKTGQTDAGPYPTQTVQFDVAPGSYQLLYRFKTAKDANAPIVKYCGPLIDVTR